jgi:23S rRNA pseudouridine2605 synthase
MSVLKFGMFVNIQGGLAEGLVPLALMGNDRFGFDPKRNELTGQRSRRTFRVGNRLTVTLVEANPVLGKLTFALGKVDVASLPPREHRGPRMGGADRPRPARGVPPQGEGNPRPFRPREGFGPKHFNKPPRREWTEQEDLRLEGVDELPISDTPAPYGQRRDERPTGDKPRGARPQGDRPQGDRPRRAWTPDGPPRSERKPRWNPDGPPQGDRPQGDRPRRAWNPDGPPRGERKPRWNPDGPPQGDRPQGDRPRRAWNPDGPPRGERKPRWNPDGPPQGDRPARGKSFGKPGDRPRGKPDFAKREGGGKPSFGKGPRKPGGPKGPPRGRKPRP